MQSISQMQTPWIVEGHKICHFFAVSYVVISLGIFIFSNKN